MRLSRFVPSGGCYHVARVTYGPGGRLALHDHDFAEVCWIEAGAGEHHINGRTLPLAPGDLFVIRPRDAHGFRCLRGPMTLANIAFATETSDDLRERYFADRDWPLAGGDLPAMFRLTGPAMSALHDAMSAMSMRQQSRLALDRFLLTLLGELTRRSEVDPGLPAWLARAIVRFAETPGALAEGVPALASMAHRSREHIGRVIKQHTGQTTTDLINALRLDHAAHALRLTDRPIVDLAADAGLPNLAHFYKLFKARFDTTPRRYRLRHQAVVRGES